MQLLNLDGSFPVADAYHATNTAGVIRFISAADPNTLSAHQRYQGDVVNRFRINEAKINEVIQAIVRHPVFSGWDDSAYTKVDGSRGFASPVSGVNPTDNSHLTTKEYVDNIATVMSDNVGSLEERLDNFNQTTVHYSDWVEHTWNASAKMRVSLPLSSSIPDLDKIVSITILEKLDTASPTTAIPNPPEQWIYRQVPIGGTVGAVVDDMWLDGSGNVNIVLPNTAFYKSGYDSVYEATQSVRTRFYRAVVTALQ